ncbi:MAG: NAD(P)/FAD-dependent oxidoreductase [Paracoccaceae bacterium]
MGGIVVVGGGQAGASLVAKLRSLGYDGALTLISEEPVPPYQRPPLSKAYLMGDMTAERLFLKPEAFYADQNIDLRLSARVDRIDPAAKTVHMGGAKISYDHLALCTGSVPRRLPAAIGGDLDGVFEVRTLTDVDEMSPSFQAGRHVLVIGGGYIGLEAAAVASKLGLKVTLVEMAERILQRVAAPQTSDYFRLLHASHGVDLREGVGLERLLGDSHVTGAKLNDGTDLAIDSAIAGVGIAPGSSLAEAAGLTIDNGIRTDDRGRTSDPSIWAAGDCASLPYRGQRIRLESVQNAIDQAEAVAANMLGADQAYIPKPWFWSDQYDVKLQIAGLNTGYDRVAVRPGDKPGTTSHWYYKGEELLAVDAMNDARNYMIGKRLIEGGKSPARTVIEDPATDMKALLK